MSNVIPFTKDPSFDGIPRLVQDPQTGLYDIDEHTGKEITIGCPTCGDATQAPSTPKEDDHGT